MMSDRPNDEQPRKPASHESDGWPEEENAGAVWHAPGEEEAAAPAEDSAEAGWHTPDEASAPLTPAAPAQPASPRPGGWYQPATAPTGGGPKPSEGGWYIPAGIEGDRLLDGVDATIYPQPEPAPVEEETSERPPEPAAEPSAEAVAESDAAAVAAAMAAKLAGEAEAAEAVAATGGTVHDTLAGEEPTPEPQATSPLAGLVAQFDRVEEEVTGLRHRYRRGTLSRDALQAELRKLMLLDEQGYWWMIGVESDVWYRYENGQWVSAERPRLAPVEAQGTDAMLASEYGRYDAAEEVVTGQTFAADSAVVPEMQTHVPRLDPEATLVGAAAVAFDQLPSSQETMPGQRFTDQTMMAGTYQPTVESYGMAQAAQEPLQPDYGAALDGSQSDLYRHVQERQARQSQSWIVRAAIAAVVGGLGLVLLVIAGLVLFYVSKVGQYNDRIEALTQLASQFETTRIYDRNNNLLSSINDPTGGTRISVPLDEISPWMIHATISTENERFFEDPGWDAIAVVRAMIQNVQEGEVVSGFSSITQQLARALVLEADRRTEISLSRKIDEVIIAAEIGRRYTKNEILELYLNEIYYGNLAYGVEAAAQTYFGISARDLNLPQAALLASIVQAPATYDPVVNRETAFSRMDIVLGLMVERGCIQFQHEPYIQTGPFCVTQQNVASAVVEKAQVEAREYNIPTNTIRYPHFVNFVAQQLEENYGLADIYRTGFNVYTTLDPGLQDVAQAVAAQEVANLQAQGIGGNNASVVVMDPRDGAILAMVGSVDYNNASIDGQVNVAFSPQQPGSSIKPLVYTAAFAGNPSGQYWYPGTVVWDTPTCWAGYCPSNYDGAYHGPQSVRSALGNSYNIPAVKALEFVTVERFAQVAQSMGLTFPGNTPQLAGLTGALGGFDVRLYDMVVAFGTLANNGRRAVPYTITRITDVQGNNIPLPSHPEPQQVIQPEHAYMINHILSDDRARSAAFGSGSILNIAGYTVAVKTGTTNDNRDNWTIGYTPNVVVGVWHGNTNNAPMRGTSGITGAAPIWNRVMTAALAGKAPVEFTIPPNVATAEICADSGTQPSARCLNRRQELYAVAQPPASADNDIFRQVQVSTLYGLVANQFCPNFVAEQTFLNISDPTAFEWINNTTAGRQWAAARGIAVPARPVPTQACDANIQQPIINVDFPLANGEVEGVVEVRGRVVVYDFRSYQLEYGVGAAAQNFTVVDGPYAVSHANSEFLGRWDVSQLPNGPYTLRLSVLTNGGGYAVLDIPVQVDNPIATPTYTPTVAIVTQTPTPSWTPLIITATSQFPTPIQTTPPPIVVTATPGPSLETALPVFDLNQAIPVSYGAVATGVIADSALATYYRFDGVAGETVRITADTTAGTLDTLLYLWDLSGTPLAENDDANNTTNSEIQFQLPATGTYVIVVTRFDVAAGFTNGEFRLTLTKLG